MNAKQLIMIILAFSLVNLAAFPVWFTMFDELEQADKKLAEADAKLTQAETKQAETKQLLERIEEQARYADERLTLANTKWIEANEAEKLADAPLILAEADKKLAEAERKMNQADAKMNQADIKLKQANAKLNEADKAQIPEQTGSSQHSQFELALIKVAQETRPDLANMLEQASLCLQHVCPLATASQVIAVLETAVSTIYDQCMSLGRQTSSHDHLAIHDLCMDFTATLFSNEADDIMWDLNDRYFN